MTDKVDNWEILNQSIAVLAVEILKHRIDLATVNDYGVITDELKTIIGQLLDSAIPQK